MGYYTDHTLNVQGIESEERFLELRKKLEDEEIIHYAIDEGHYIDEEHFAYFYPVDSVKWYDHSGDMIMISEIFPEMTFMLDGSGEDFGDLWHEYFKNGVCETCRGTITYEEPTHIKWDS